MKRTRLTRRSLLAGGMALGSAWLFAGSSSRARFGDFTPRTDPWGPNASDRPISRVLEVFSYGGLSPWDTFYVNPATASTGLQWGTFRTQFQELADQDPRRNGAPLTKPFSLGIELGPATYPLWRPDLFDHLQVLVTSHDLLPHEAAIPYALTGSRLGRPTMTGTGAAVSKAYGRDVPVAFVLEPEGVTPTDNLRASENTGTLGGASRPLRLTVPDAGPDLSVLGRPSAPAQDALLRHYIDEYAARLTWPDDAPAVTRSAAFSDYRITMDRYLNVEAIAGLVGGYDPSDDAAIRGPEPDVFGGRPTSNSTRHCLNLAAYLLAQEQTRYVAVMDFGREHPGGAGYDTHGDHVMASYRNITNTLEVIANLTDPSQPGGPKIDPFTMIVLTTEFGRTPAPQGTTGRNHYPAAYTSVLIPPRIEGPAFPFRPTKRLHGRIDADGRAQNAITPTDLRAALLLGLGVDPLVRGQGEDTGALFGVGDMSEPMQGADGEEQTVRLNLIRRVLGYEV